MPQVSELFSVYLRLSAATASPEATAALARDLRADRDGTIRKLVGQRHAADLPRLPRVLRRRISRQITALVGKRGAQEGPRLPASGLAELPRSLAKVLISVAILLFGEEAGSSQPSLPPDHPCAELEQKMCAAYDLALAAQKTWLLCRTGSTTGTPEGGSGGGGGDSGQPGGVVFEDGPGESSPGPSGGSEEDCEELWQRSLTRSDQWLQAASAFNNCMQGQA